MKGLAKWLLRLLRLATSLCAALLILLACWVALGRELMPWVADFRADVEALASKAIGKPLHIGRLEGRWQGFAPVFHAYQVEIGEGSERLSLEQLELHPDIVSSLLARAPRLAYTRLNGLDLKLAQNADGSWHAAGLPTSDKAPDMAAFKALLAALQPAQILLQDSRLTVQAQGAKALVFNYASFSLQSATDSSVQLSAQMHLPSGAPLLLRLALRLDEDLWYAPIGSLYLNLPAQDWAPYLPAQLLHGVLEKPAQLAELKFGAQLWLKSTASGVQQGALHLNADKITLKVEGSAPLRLAQLALDGHFSKKADSINATLKQSAAQFGGSDWQGMQLSWQQQGAKGALAADQLELAPLLSLFSLAKLPETARNWLDGLQPAGTVRNLTLDYHADAPLLERLHFAANLENISVSAHEHVPAFANLSGSIEGSPAGGELRFDSRDLQLHLNDIFAARWHYPKAAGTLKWTLADNVLTLALPYVKVEGAGGEQAAADMRLALLFDDFAESYLDLRVGILKGSAAQVAQYLPISGEHFSEELSNWLQTAIKSGVASGFFQYQGAVAPHAPEHARVINLYLKAEDGELAFQPGWPSLQKTSALLFVENGHVRIEQAQGTLLQSRFNEASAEILPAAEGKVPLLHVSAKVNQRLQDLLYLLQQAPLGTHDTFAGWTGSGLLNGQLDLDIPLGAGTPRVRAEVRTDAASLTIAHPALALDKIKGDFAYDSRKGLSSKAFRGEALGHAVRGNISAEAKNGAPSSRIEASGQVAFSALQDWLTLEQPLPLSGTLPYHLALSVEGGGSELRIDSSLKGLTADLPPPFAKAAEEERESYLRLVMPPSGQKLWFASYGGLARLALSQGQTPQALRGEILLGMGQGLPSLPRPPAPSGISVRGRLAQVDASAWQALFAPYLASPSSGTLHSLLREVNLRIGTLQAAGNSLSALSLQVAQQSGGWAVELGSDEIKGQLLLEQGKPLQVTLDYLYLPKTAAQPAGDPLAAFDPRQIPPLDVRVNRLFYADEPLGALNFKVRPSAQGMQIEAIDLDIRQLKIGGSFAWENSAGGYRSSYKGRLQGSNLADVLAAWHFAPNVSSERFHLDVDGSWPGSPLGFALAQFSGNLKGSAQKGQFRQVEGGASALRIFGLLNFEAIGRRLRLDFTDLFGKGLSYDRFKGSLAAEKGFFRTQTPFSLKGPSSDLELSGTLDMQNEQVNAELQVMLPLTNNLPLAALIAGAPAVGGALFVIDRLLGDKVSRLASVHYQIQGNLYDPQITPVKQAKATTTAAAGNAEGQ